MAHQAHNIPWSTFSSNLKWRQSCVCKGEATDLHLRYKPDQGKKFKYFVTAFARNIHTFADSERAKYQDHSDPPGLDAVIINEEVALKIAPTIARRWIDYFDAPRNQKEAWNHGRTAKPSKRPCAHAEEDSNCYCAMRLADRKVKSFLTFNPQNLWRHDFTRGYEAGVLNVEIFEALMLYGEMEPILRLAAHPENQLIKLWDEADLSYGRSKFIGWNRIAHMAIQAYVLLNVIYYLPEIWAPSKDRKGKDYRSTQVYQRLLWCLCGRQESDVVTYPHRQFFAMEYFENERSSVELRDVGMEDARFHRTGHKSFDEMVQHPRHMKPNHKHSRDEVLFIRWVLAKHGLPFELQQDIMELAGIEVTRRLPMAHDPFHRDNSEELMSYLAYCWKLVVRCTVLGNELGMDIDWEEEITRQILLLFDCSCSPGLVTWYTDEDTMYRKPKFR